MKTVTNPGLTTRLIIYNLYLWTLLGNVILYHQPCKLYKPKQYWCPELSKARDTKRFWWHLWIDNGRPRCGEVYRITTASGGGDTYFRTAAPVPVPSPVSRVPTVNKLLRRRVAETQRRQLAAVSLPEPMWKVWSCCDSLLGLE